MSLFPPAPEAKDSVCPITSLQAQTHQLPPLRVIWQESVPPTEARLIITVNLLLYIPRVLFLNATVPLTIL